MKQNYPLLTKNHRPLYPANKSCPICGSDFTNGSAYLSSGIVVDADHSDTLAKLSPEAFLDIGFHGKTSNMSDSANVAVVDNLSSEQFDIQTCSIHCLRKLFNQICDDLEAQMAQDHLDPPAN